MLLQGLYDFTPRLEDTDKTLGFKKDELLLFLSVFPKNVNWFQVADRKGRIGYIPRNYVRMLEEVTRDVILDFLLEASVKARRAEQDENADTLDKLKDHIVRVEYREFQTRLLRQAMNTPMEGPLEHDPSEISEDPEVEAYEGDPDDDTDGNVEREVPDRMTSNCSLYTPKSERTFGTSQTPVVSRVSPPHSPYVPTRPVSGRPSKSCPQCPLNSSMNQQANCSMLENTQNNQYQGHASGDTLAYESEVFDVNYSKTYGPNELQPSSKVSSTTTRIPIRTRNSSNTPRDDVSGRTYTMIGTTARKQHSVSSTESVGGDLERMAGRLVKIVQESGGLDMKQSEVVVQRVLHHVRQYFHPGMPDKVESVLKILQGPQSSTSQTSDPGAGRKLVGILNNLSNCVKRKFYGEENNNNYDKRNSSRYDMGDFDESSLLDKLEQLSEELLQLDSKTLRVALQSGHLAYHSLHDLVLLYQSDRRSSIKTKMLEVFSMIATGDPEARSSLLRSILPIELARELFDNEERPRILSQISNTLISLLASGEGMPRTHLDALGAKFVSFLLNYVEESVGSVNDFNQNDAMLIKSREDVMNLLLAYNLQFGQQDDNIFMKAVAARQPGQNFIEMLIQRFELQTDPIQDGSNLVGIPHSVFKLMRDLFSSKMTAEHFHKAEMKWLIDNIIQNLSGVTPGDIRRTDYLELLRLVLRNRYFHYRISDTRDSLVGILAEEEQLSNTDQQIVRAIYKEFPNVFKKSIVTPLGTETMPF